MATRQGPGTRARDADRTAICQLLDGAYAEGQLSMEEHRQRVGAAVNATTLGELRALVEDLQTVGPPPEFGASPRQPFNPRAIVAAAGVLAVCVVVVSWLVVRSLDHDSETPSPAVAEPSQTHAMAADPTSTTPVPEDPAPVVLAAPPDLLSAEGMTRVIDEIRKRFGDTMGYELAITAERAMLARPDPTDERSKLIYTYERGWGDPTTRSRSDTDDLVDIAAFDVAAAAAAVRTAPETLRIAPADVEETYFDVDHITEPPGPGALELLIRVGTTRGADGWIYLDSAGSVKRVEFPS